MPIFTPDRTMPATPTDSGKIQVDTITGDFLFELNVAYSCYSRFDQIEQLDDIIIYDSLLLKRDLQRLYRKGMYVILPAKRIQDFLKQPEIRSRRKDSSVFNFLRPTFVKKRAGDSLFYASATSDRTGRLLYRKFHATLVCAKIGPVETMIPDMRKYKCCYANKKEQIDSWYILEVINGEWY